MHIYSRLPNKVLPKKSVLKNLEMVCMNDREVESYKKAGKIWSDVRKELLEKLKPGAKLLDLAEFAEGRIKKFGGGLAFPLNLSLNEIAAHYTPTVGDQTVIKKSDLLKVDMGVEVDGYIADAAFTYCSEPHPLITAVEAAMSAALGAVRLGLTTGELGAIIEDAAKKHGAGMVVNLTGHGLDQYIFHASPSVPNVRSGARAVLEEGMAIAIEPFVCTQKTDVREAAPVEIYRFVQDKPVRSTEARAVLAVARDVFRGFPFAKRHILDISPLKVSMALRELERIGAVESYAPLKEPHGNLVAQMEHTLLIGDPVIVTTK